MSDENKAILEKLYGILQDHEKKQTEHTVKTRGPDTYLSGVMDGILECINAVKGPSSNALGLFGVHKASERKH